MEFLVEFFKGFLVVIVEDFFWEFLDEVLDEILLAFQVVMMMSRVNPSRENHSRTSCSNPLISFWENPLNIAEECLEK